MKKTFVSSCKSDTLNFAADFSKSLSGGEVIALSGGLGAGKTCFVKGLAQGLGYAGTVTSPTFAIVNEYVGGRLSLFHFDMYRITGWDDLNSTGYFEYLRSGGILAIEWSENIEGALEGENVIRINIEPLSENERKITVWSDSFI
ncbi:MAG: tRNA (adenosine(37)-N6)-threonylcarbamoyltransferase complex ATPase subunit type 1 TsaE [Clostridia bacterium]|nr:tRNA (adenosine(37)-N6)-threonylcarbamoyltransferase complex ATPase subunit type 1 TsaE [Clostridia bacterium]